MYIGIKILCFHLIGCILVGVPVTSLALCADNKLQVIEMEQLPKYGLTKDLEDRRQLTDGCTNRFPLWVHRDSVGWAGQTPITLHLRLSSAQSSHPRVSGQIGFHTAKGKNAGVHVPRRIDLYSLGRGGHYAHVGGKTISDAEVKDGKNHWIWVPVESASSDYMAVLHATGSYLMLDEIHWNNKAGGDVQSEKTVVGTKEQVLKDSLNRLKKSFSKGNWTVKNVDKLRTTTSRRAFATWVENPWGSLKELPTAKQMLAADEGVSVIGLHGEKESSCIGLSNAEALRQSVKVSMKGESVLGDTITIRKLGSVLAANGEQVFDPIVALDERQLELSPGGREYLWVTFDLDQLKPGKYDYQLEIRGTNKKLITTINYRVQVLPSFENNLDEPRAVVWSYLKDIPVKNNPQLALEDLSAHGVNVFVIHPSNIPQPGKDQDWNSDAVRKLHRAVKHYAGHGLILLFLGWPNGLGNIGKQPLSQQKEIIKEWVAKLDRQMTSIGLRNDAWALYPIDEPRGARLDFLKKVVVWIKDATPNIRIYANPITTSDGKTTLADLRYLDQYIDYWQPYLSFAKGAGHKFFSETDKEWWTYGVPESPAKAAKPVDYRRLAWDAWRLGANGTGFWSYSDTRNSSAWDDFDGRRPDWAVVYESDAEPVSSRRWEAFRDGMEDFRLLKSLLNTEKDFCKGSDFIELHNELCSLPITRKLKMEDILSLRNKLISILDQRVSSGTPGRTFVPTN